MLEIKQAEQGDIAGIERLLIENNIYQSFGSYISNCMVTCENGKIIGSAGFIQKDNLALITFVVVAKDRRREYLGDGLLKSLLNLASNRGIKKAIVNWGGDFLLKVGFVSVSKDDAQRYFEIFEEVKLNMEIPLVEVTLPEFFLRSCKASKFLK